MWQHGMGLARSITYAYATINRLPATSQHAPALFRSFTPTRYPNIRQQRHDQATSKAQAFQREHHIHVQAVGRKGNVNDFMLFSLHTLKQPPVKARPSHIDKACKIVEKIDIQSWFKSPPPKPGYSKAALWTSRLFILLNMFNYALRIKLILFYQFTLYKRPFDMDCLWENSILSLDNLFSGRFWVLLTHSFTHFDLCHLAFNCIQLGTFAKQAVYSRIIRSPVQFVSLYVGSAVFAGTAHLLIEQHGAIGASACVYALSTVLAMGEPDHKTWLIAGIPLPMRVSVPLNLAIDIQQMLSGNALEWTADGNVRVGHVAHVAGAVYGVFFYVFTCSRAPRRSRRKRR